MKLLLELLKKILSRLSNSYTKEETDGALSLKIGIEEFDDGLAESSDLRVAGDSALIQKLEANKANDDALANVVKWKTYAIAMQKMVDENLAIQIAEEFEKAAVEYLADPTVRKNWITNSATESTSPYFSIAPTRPVIDFNVVTSTGGYGKGAFISPTNVPVFLPNATICNSMLNTISSFNQPLILPKATSCQYLLNYAGSFDQPLNLPLATNCSYMLQYAKAFNSSLDLPKALNCSYMLASAAIFNQPVDLPEATNVAALLQNAKAFNNSLTLPKAVWCSSILINCSKFNQAVSLPNCSLASWAFQNTAIDAQNISQTLDSLKDWSYDTSSQVHEIGFVNTPGIVSTATTETFTVTDGVTDYSFDYCPSFDTDDDNQSLRKSFVLVVMKKGWTVSMNHPIFHGEDGRGVYANGTMKSLAVSLPNLTNAGDTEDNGMFYNCTELESISVSGLSKLKTAGSMFYKCEKLKTLTGFPSVWPELVKAGNSANYGRWGMFSYTALETTLDWTFPKLTSARALFNSCKKLTRVGTLSFPVLTDQAFWSYGVGMFRYCSSLVDISGLSNAFPVLKVWSGMFSGCSSLSDFTPILSQFSNNATIAFGTFDGTAIESWSTDAVNLTNADAMFRNCSKLKTVSGNFQSVTVGGGGSHGMFANCKSLESVSSAFPSLSNGVNMFIGCSMLNIESAEHVLNSLPEWTDGSDHVITFVGCNTAIEAGLNSDNLAVLSAVAKGWTVEL